MIWLTPEDRKRREAMEQEVSREKLSANWEQIMKWTPMPSGSPQEWQAVQFLQAKLEEYGVAHQIIWYEGNVCNPIEAQLTVLAPKEQTIPCAPYRQVTKTPEEGIQGELIYIPPEELGKREAKDKIVLSERVLFKEIAALQKMGVKAVVAIEMDTFAPDVIHQRADFSVSGNPTSDNYHIVPQLAMVSVSSNDGQRLKTLCKQGAVQVHLKSIVEDEWKRLPLLIADIRGKKDPEKFILVNGHIDTPPFSPGVTDNASGDAMMLELARIFNQNRVHLNRSIRVAFWTGHEIGRYAGSTWYNDAFWHDLRYNCITCVNIDSPGASGATTYGPLYMSESVDLQRESIREVTGLEIERTLWPGRDGDSSFWGTGLSNVGFFSEQPEAEADPFVNYAGLGWWWHTPFATLDRGDPEILARDTIANVNFIFKLGNCPILPMNFVPYAGELVKILEELQEKVDKVRAYFNLKVVLERAKNFKRDAEILEALVQETITAYETASNPNVFTSIFEELNQCLMWVCRYVNIVAHSNASKAEQMSMENFGLKPFPRLQPILDLTNMPLPHNPEFKRLVTKLVRQRNFVEDGFYLASKQIRDTLTTVKAAIQ